VQPRDAATVLLVRDAPDLHVFMLQRNLASVFAAGAHVFPGGAVDAADDELARRSPAASVGPVGCARRFRVAAIRETFEEAGVLLARPPAAVDATRLAAGRARLRAGTVSFAGLVDELGVELDTEALLPLARFVTPPGAPRRFDTWFFVAAAPDGHGYRHDDGETVASLWIRPRAALARDRHDGFWLVPPTRWTLEAIGGFARRADLLAAIRAAWADGDAPVRGGDVAPEWVLDLAAGGVAAPAGRRRSTPA
jgi:8-oxo-dGTP pyrophosphatase MutT (NUDIX family)